MIKNKKNIGYIGALKQLIDASTTDIVGILDPDDALYPEASQEVLNIYNNHKEYGFVYTNFQAFDEFCNKKVKSMDCAEKANDKTALIYGFVSHLKTFRKSQYLQTTMLDETMLYAEDRDLCYMMEEVTKFYFINKKLYKYRRTPNSQSSGKKKQIGKQNHVKARRKCLSRRNIKGFDLFIHELYNVWVLSDNIFVNAIMETIVRVIYFTNHSSGQLRHRSF